MKLLFSLPQLVFYSFAILSVFSALMVIVSKNPVRSVLFLILCFFATAGIWILLEVEFLAITLVLVYVGAVMVLFLFVVMMLDIEIASLKEGFTRHLPLGICVAVLVMIGISFAIGTKKFSVSHLVPPSHPASYSQVKELGLLLYTQYLYPFIVAGVLLLVAIVAAISLTFRGNRGSKAPIPDWQVKVQKKDRLRVIKMPSKGSST